MDPILSVDLISDLNLGPEDDFNWEGKPTSLFCSIAGNISSDLEVVKRTLNHLSNFYRGIMYIDGSLEHSNLENYSETIGKLKEICDPLSNVVYMHNHVVILNSVAFVSINGWFENHPHITEVSDLLIVEDFRVQDFGYLGNTLKSLQRHKDAKKIVITSSCAPSGHLLFNHNSNFNMIEPALALVMDTENKSEVWLYGGTNLIADEITSTRRFVNNPFIKGQPYWPKRVLV
jgi:hypothetical protein